VATPERILLTVHVPTAELEPFSDTYVQSDEVRWAIELTLSG